MKATIISDRDCRSQLYQNLNQLVVRILNDLEMETTQMAIGRDELAFCRGCFGCWIKKPGECIINDMMAQINRHFVNSDAVIYITPIVFGQFSANIKNALDRWIPNMLPFFLTRPDGSTMHPSRYDKNPRVVMVGCADELPEEDRQLFMDINQKHRSQVEVLLYQGSDRDILEAFHNLELGRVGGYL